ncbi:hypothetical protein [Edaphobacter acidisoli]|nr:hypothetical protein [Edaphobacter acidisoli]
MPIAAMSQSAGQVPVPSQFATAHNIFLAAGGAPALGNRAKLATNMSYDSMYHALETLTQYHLVANPASSDLAMETSIHVAVGNAGNQFNSVSLRLVVRDTKTQTLLWILDEPLDGAFREKTFQKNLDDAASHLAQDLKVLSEGREPQV